MQIKFELSGVIDEALLSRVVLPVGYVAEKDQSGNYYIKLESNREIVAICELVKDEPFVLFSFFDVKSNGRNFMSDFGLKYPELDPKTILFGFVYKTPDGLFHLDVMPMKKRIEALKSLKKYVAMEKAYFVSFRRGDWFETSLKVLSMRKIYFDGSLGEDEMSHFPSLEISEN